MYYPSLFEPVATNPPYSSFNTRHFMKNGSTDNTAAAAAAIVPSLVHHQHADLCLSSTLATSDKRTMTSASSSAATSITNGAPLSSFRLPNFVCPSSPSSVPPYNNNNGQQHNSSIAGPLMENSLILSSYGPLSSSNHLSSTENVYNSTMQSNLMEITPHHHHHHQAHSYGIGSSLSAQPPPPPPPLSPTAYASHHYYSMNTASYNNKIPNVSTTTSTYPSTITAATAAAAAAAVQNFYRSANQAVHPISYGHPHHHQHHQHHHHHASQTYNETFIPDSYRTTITSAGCDNNFSSSSKTSIFPSSNEQQQNHSSSSSTSFSDHLKRLQESFQSKSFSPLLNDEIKLENHHFHSLHSNIVDDNDVNQCQQQQQQQKLNLSKKLDKTINDFTIVKNETANIAQQSANVWNPLMIDDNQSMTTIDQRKLSKSDYNEHNHFHHHNQQPQQQKNSSELSFFNSKMIVSSSSPKTTATSLTNNNDNNQTKVKKDKVSFFSPKKKISKATRIFFCLCGI